MHNTELATAPEPPRWSEVESEVHCLGRWLALAIGTCLLLAGTAGFLTIAQVLPPGLPVWIAKLCAIAFGILGGIILAWAVSSFVRPVHIRHAVPDALSDVPSEPIIREGSVVHGRLTHELVGDDQQWQFRPARNAWRNDKTFVFGFGVPFLIVFAGLLTWIFHSQLNFAGWFLSALCAATLTLVSGGSALVMIAMTLRSNFRRLCRLSIPCNGDDIELDSPEELDPEKTDLVTGLKWIFLGETKRQRLTIPRELVSAVQLCPWEFAVGRTSSRTTTWAVQGLLVLRRVPERTCHRLPILLTSDFVGAARLMGRLASTLDVPYLFCADEEGWTAEARRAKTRQALQIGGMVS